MIFILFSLRGLEIIDIQTGAWSLMVGEFYPYSGGFSLVVNPSANRVENFDFSFYYSKWFEEIHNGGAVVRFNLGGFSNAFFLRGVYSANIERFPEEGAYSAGFYSVGFNLSKKVGGIYTGVNLNTWLISFEEEKGYGFHFDLGFSKEIANVELFLSVKNIGTGFSLDSISTPHPLRIGSGVFCKTRAISFSFPLVYSSNAKFYLNPGILFTPFKVISFGLNFSTEVEGVIEKFGTGFSLNVGPVKLSYAVHPFSVGYVHSLEASISAQKVSEEEIAKKVEEEFRKRMEEASNAYLERGIVLFEEKKFDEAMEAWDIALIWNPANKQAMEWMKKVEKEKKKMEIEEHVEQAKKYFLAGDYISAQKEASQALALDSTNNLAKFYYEEATQKIQENIGKAVSEKEKESLEKGMECFNKGDFEKAIKSFEEVLKINPDNRIAAEYIAKAGKEIQKYIEKEVKKVDYLLKKKRYKEAKAKVKRLLKVAPDNAELLKKLGEIEDRMDKEIQRLLDNGEKYYQKKDYSSARRYFESVLVLDPHNSKALSYLDKIKKKEKKVDPQKYYILGVQAYADGDYELAIAYWEKVLSVDPENDNARKNIERARSKLLYIKRY